MPPQEVLEGALVRAVRELRRRDAALRDTTERVVAGRLLVYLDRFVRAIPALDGYDVDLEYERAGNDPKRFVGQDVQGRPLRRKIIPDLIVHRRLDAEDPSANLLAVEIKARTGGDELHDEAKLALLTGRESWVHALQAPRTLRRPTQQTVRPPDGVAWVGLPQGIHPYRYGALLRLHLPKNYIEWV